MKAHANKDSLKSTDVMYGAAEKISEAALVLMQAYGIQEIVCKKMSSGDYERLIGEITPFLGTPQGVIDAAVLIKDNLAAIIASAGIVGLSIEAVENEVGQLVASYETMVNLANDEASKRRAEAEGSDQTDSGDLDAAADEPVEVKIPEGDSSHA